MWAAAAFFSIAFSDLVEEPRAAVRFIEQACAILARTGERAARAAVVALSRRSWWTPPWRAGC